MINQPNPLLEAYINQKEEEIERDVKTWVHILRMVYKAARKEGFTSRQSMEIVEMQWTRSDDWKFKEKILKERK
jgi:hypothetical protein